RNPLTGLYRTADDRYLSFVMMQPGKFWADVCRGDGRPRRGRTPAVGGGGTRRAPAGEAGGATAGGAGGGGVTRGRLFGGVRYS
ncbi:hypothetical protein ABZ896_47375, partial [Streptomyces sp. NPDC047072]